MITTILSAALLSSGWYIGEIGADNTVFLIQPAPTAIQPYKRAWVHMSYPAIRNNVSHIVMLQEFDCKLGRSRFVQLTLHYATGAPDTDNRIDSWSYAAPGTVVGNLLKTACSALLPEHGPFDLDAETLAAQVRQLTK
jgi:hypothetical protein